MSEHVDVDVIRARADEFRALLDGDAEPSDYDAMRLAFASQADIPALLDALAAARAEVEPILIGFTADVLRLTAERDAARAEVAALRERLYSLGHQWLRDQAAYPGSPEGRAAAAAVRLCKDEMAAVLAAPTDPKEKP